jgi:catechol 2,3-dioxygenase-like lactoylglutathione lyase family enzyme
MSTQFESPSDPNDPDRREIIRAGAVTLASLAGSVSAMGLPAFAQGAPDSSAATNTVVRNSAPLGARLQGVQHIGITVQNMERAFEFYTEVLGGTEITRAGDFHGERMHNAILLNEEIDAKRQKIDPKTIGVADLRSGAQRLDTRLIQFDNVIIELLQYRDRQQPQGSGASFAPPLDLTSPAYPRSMHICFYVRDDVDFTQFIRDFEAECARRGMTRVKANRVIAAPTEQARQQAHRDSNTNRITEGTFDGQAMMYAKGPEGEQLEFIQVLGRAKQLYSSGLEARHHALEQQASDSTER